MCRNHRRCPSSLNKQKQKEYYKNKAKELGVTPEEAKRLHDEEFALQKEVNDPKVKNDPKKREKVVKKYKQSEDQPKKATAPASKETKSKKSFAATMADVASEPLPPQPKVEEKVEPKAEEKTLPISQRTPKMVPPKKYFLPQENRVRLPAPDSVNEKEFKKAVMDVEPALEYMITPSGRSYIAVEDKDAGAKGKYMIEQKDDGSYLFLRRRFGDESPIYSSEDLSAVMRKAMNTVGYDDESYDLDEEETSAESVRNTVWDNNHGNNDGDSATDIRAQRMADQAVERASQKGMEADDQAGGDDGSSYNNPNVPTAAPEVDKADYQRRWDSGKPLSDYVKSGDVIMLDGEPHEVMGFRRNNATLEYEVQTGTGENLRIPESQTHRVRFLGEDQTNKSKYEYEPVKDNDFSSTLMDLSGRSEEKGFKYEGVHYTGVSTWKKSGSFYEVYTDQGLVDIPEWEVQDGVSVFWEKPDMDEDYYDDDEEW